MSFLKKKRFKFQTDIIVADLSDVPFVNATLFAKVRLLDGGRYAEHSPRVEVISHHVCWDQNFKFVCRIAANPHSGVLEACYCRVSIRREYKGGSKFTKLGFVDINLSEFAGSGQDGQTRSYLLEGYGSSQHGQDNSRLRLNVAMVLLTPDPCFKVPVHPSSLDGSHLNPADRKGPSPSFTTQPSTNGSSSSGNDQDGQSVNSGSSGFESLPRSIAKQKQQHPAITFDEPTPTTVAGCLFEPSHSRTPSQTSQPSVTSGYGSGGTPLNPLGIPNNNHSRQASTDTQFSSAGALGSGVLGHSRRPSSDIRNSMGLECTRPDAGAVIDDILFNELGPHMDIDNNSGEASGLQLYICKEDGTAALGSRGSTLKPGTYEQVVIQRLSDDDR